MWLVWIRGNYELKISRFVKTLWYQNKGVARSYLWAPDTDQSILFSLIAAVDTVVRDLLPKRVYYRFNPNMASDIAMDENRVEILEQLQADARSYTEKNFVKLQKAADVLLQNKGAIQQLRDRINFWYAARWLENGSKYFSLFLVVLHVVYKDCYTASWEGTLKT